MALIIEQRFPLGRFHATRWNQGSFGDAYGEWPPSPWRLLRALAMRWFQYARETGDAETAIRDSLLQSLAGSMPAFSLPSSTWRGRALKQYQPTALEEHYIYKKDPGTKKSVIDYSYRQVTTTLNKDNYRAVPPDESLFWRWEKLDLPAPQQELLDRLLERTLYFGRVESFSRLRRVTSPPVGTEINCRLERQDNGSMTPVLAHLPERPLDLAILLAATDDKELKGRSIPPGTAWFYAQVPRQAAPAYPKIHNMNYPDNLHCIQFAVGGRVYPPLRQYVKVTNRFRGRVLRSLAGIVAPESEGHYDLLSPEQREKLALIGGKDRNGQPLRGHRHAYFMFWPDENGLPTRLVVWRSTAFTEEEIAALLSASKYSVAWDDNTRDWRLRLVPIPFETPIPKGLLGESYVWESLTPFVPPADRHRFRKNGRERPGESIERLLTKLLISEDKPVPQKIIVNEHIRDAEWVNLHETRDRRLLKSETRTPMVRPGFNIRVEFDLPIEGPLIIGDSCHFGLGLFQAVNT